MRAGPRARKHRADGACRGVAQPRAHDAMQHQFIEQRKALIHHILQQAVDRGEIDAAAISDELWDLLPGYLIFRSIIPSRPPTRRTVQALVDDVIIPSLTRPTG